LGFLESRNGFFKSLALYNSLNQTVDLVFGLFDFSALHYSVLGFSRGTNKDLALVS